VHGHQPLPKTTFSPPPKQAPKSDKESSECQDHAGNRGRVRQTKWNRTFCHRLSRIADAEFDK